MNSNDYQIYFDCGFSVLRAAAFNKIDLSKIFSNKSKFLFDSTEIGLEIQKIITYLEKNTGEYIDDINLMIDSSKMKSIGISISKKIDQSQLRNEDIQFLVQEAKQQILKYYNDQNVIHIIINNYKINDIDYDYLPKDIKSNFISLDMLFICIPKETVDNFKNLFHKFDISINQITCSSYAKAINYKDNFPLYKNISFIDVGFNKTSVITFFNNKIISLDILLIGGNHITKDISKILKINLKQAENYKINFNKCDFFLNDKNFSLELLQKIIIARTEEILEMCTQSIKSNLNRIDQHKIIITGEGSKILNIQPKDKTALLKDAVFLEETTKDICLSGFKLGMGLNKQEVAVVPKIPIKQGFFEKLFHLIK
tara:strand:- start:1060 stop:2169 length:1110 start_codon:yes stop_codon:yes gene_type:complete